MRRRRSRWLVLVTMAAAALLAPLTFQTAAAQAPPGGQSFVTRPDLRPPGLTVHTPATGVAPGFLFLTPTPSGSNLPGPVIADNAGQLVWTSPSPAADFKVQRYNGQPVLTYYSGAVIPAPGFGQGNYVILNDAYLPIGVVRGSNGLENADLHEMTITPQNTALLAIYRPGIADLSSVGLGPVHPILESVIQEIDIATGRVLFEWRALEHAPASDSFYPPVAGQPYDFFHINSIDVDTDGNLLVSARHMHAVYKIDRRTGDVIWQLGGKANDFALGPGVAFSSQHDARRNDDGTISVFDNAAGAGAPTSDRSRGLVLNVDETARTADVAREFAHPTGVRAGSQGSHQVLPGGNSLVSYGDSPFVTEFGPGGDVRFDASFTNAQINSYRTFRQEWVGRPSSPPVGAARLGGPGMTVFASWNGATEVATWRVLAGPTPSGLVPVADAPRSGFETAIEAPAKAPLVAVQAVAADGSVLGTSIPLPPVLP